MDLEPIRAFLLRSGRFSFEQTLGKGGFGVVVRAYDHKLGRDVALKFLTRRDNPRALYRFKKEFRTLVNITHHNLAQLHELFAGDAQWFFTMEYVDGVDFVRYYRDGVALESGTLGSRPLQEGLDFDAVRGGTVQLVRGLMAIHAQGHLHRDVKPSNVLVAADGRVVVLDFGLVTELYTEQSVIFAGTPAYMSPEQAVGVPLTPASDWYSLGVVLFRVLTGVLPFSGSNWIEIRREREKYPPMPPSRIRRDIPLDLDRLCVDLMQLNPLARPTGPEILQRLSEEHEALPLQLSDQNEMLVGRETLFLQLEQAFGETRQGRPSVVMLWGGSGIGKSALVDQFLLDLEASHEPVIVLRGRCYEQEIVAFKALDSLVDALANFLKRLTREELEPLLPPFVWTLGRIFPTLKQVKLIAESSDELSTLDQTELRRRGILALRELLTTMASSIPLLLTIDDLQWGDLESASIFFRLFQPPDPPPLLLILSARPPSEGRSLTRVLDETLPRYVPAIHYSRLDVGPLGAAAARELAMLLLEPHVVDESSAFMGAAHIATEADGHPYFIRELVRFSVSSGMSAGVPQLTLEQLLRHRLKSLPMEALRLLQVICIAGRPLSLSVALKVADCGEDALFRHRRLLRDGHWIRCIGGGEQPEMLVPYHDRVRKTLLQEADRAFRRAVHRRFAELLAREGAGPEQLMAHFVAADDPEMAADCAIEAAENAMRLMAYDHAATLLEQALAWREWDASTRHKLELRLAEAYGYAGRGLESAAAFVRADGEALPDLERAEIAAQAARQLLFTGHVHEGLQRLHSAAAYAMLSLPRTRFDAFCSYLTHRIGCGLAGHRASRSASAWDGGVTHHEKGELLWTFCAGMSVLGDLRGILSAPRLLRLALKSPNPEAVARALLFEVLLSLLGGRENRRTQRARELAEQLVSGADTAYSKGVMRLTNGLAWMAKGEWPAAHQFLLQAEQMLLEAGSRASWEVSVATVQRVNLMRRLGAFAALHRELPLILSGADTRADLIQGTLIRLRTAPFLHLVRGDAAAAEDDVARAEQLCSHSGAEFLEWAGGGTRALIALYRGDLDQVRRQLPTLERGWANRLLRRSAVLAIDGCLIRGQIALALAVDQNERGYWLRKARRCARQALRSGLNWGGVVANLLLAGVSAAESATARAAHHLQSAEVAATSLGMSLYAQLAKHQRGVMIAGSEGSTLLREVAQWCAQEGVEDLARLGDALLPCVVAE